jgi:hypothetical protein
MVLGRACLKTIGSYDVGGHILDCLDLTVLLYVRRGRGKSGEVDKQSRGRPRRPRINKDGERQPSPKPGHSEWLVAIVPWFYN